MALDLDAATRQAVGSMFARTSRDDVLVEALFNRELTLPPHPTWELPAGDIDWSVDPFSDRNWLHQFPMLRWLDPLRRAAQDGDLRAGKLWTEVAYSWFVHNPPGQSAAPYGWKDMVDGIRAIELCAAAPFVQRDFPEQLSWLTQSLEDHGRWLADDRNLGHSNHALNQHMGLFVVGAVLQRRDYQEMAAARLRDLFVLNYDDEGVNAEGAIIYHHLNYKWWNEARERLLLEKFPVPAEFSVLDLAPEVLAHATKPDGNFVNIGDTDAGGPKGLGHPYTDYVTSRGAVGEPPTDVLKVYKAGYIFGRSGWGEHERRLGEETFFSLSFGRADRVHGHADGMSLTFNADGVEWLRDPGKFQYGSSAMRSYCLARDSHNVPYVVGAKYDPQAVVPLTRTQVGREFYEFTFEDRGYPGVLISRRFIYSIVGEYSVVIDTVHSSREVDVTQNWQLGPDVRAKVVRRGVELRSRGRTAALLFAGKVPTVSTQAGVDEPVGGWVATGWKTRQGATRVRLHKSGRRFRFVSVLAPGFGGKQPSVETLRDGPEGALTLAVSNGRFTERIAIHADRTELLRGRVDAIADPGTPNAPPLAAGSDGHRSAVLAAVAGARDSAASDSSLENRSRLAHELRGLLDTSAGGDLGVTACIVDLLGPVPEIDAAESRRASLGVWREGGDRTLRDARLLPIVDDVSQSFVAPIEDVVLGKQEGPFAIPVAFSPAPGDILTVMFHGALDRTKTQLPLFQRLRFQKTLAVGPVLSIADPTLDLAPDLRLAWYLGSESVDVHLAIARLVDAIAVRTGVSEIVMVGGSGGGFAALHVAAGVPDAHVVAINPQTDLQRYSPRFTQAALLAAFGVAELPEASPLRVRTSVMERYDALETLPKVTLVSNPGDQVHLRKHILPLAQYYRGRHSDGLQIMEFDLGPGHRAPSNEQYASIMSRIYGRS